jgi:hypothetical protein
MLSTQNKHWKAQVVIGARRRAFVHQCRKIEWRLRHPVRQGLLLPGEKRAEGARSRPIVHENGCRRAVVADADAFAGLPRDRRYFRKGFPAVSAALFQKVEGGGFVKRETRGAAGSPKSDMQSHTAAVRVAAKVHLPIRSVEQRKGSFSVVRQRKDMPAPPRRARAAAVVLGRRELVIRTQHFTETAPLFSVGA